ncbi:penicillin acylase family protein [Cytobacillus depressus]|uniref:Penicillin acylase family protein n=1 Tax=Cytobacillus depressus TaxID=1602942 RepID=A0A6L3V8C1_9BACI|nr:penicillin acylase family protein [Cytobacillus depressus]KAB2336847.1 penicillin acylase family protein [Cytobacillus depressus]
MKKSLVLVIACLLLLTTPLVYTGNAAGKPEPSQEIKVSGLEKSAEILIDRWGIPHIYASSKDDAFFVQGFNAARDRLWQIDLWRKRGLGQLSEVLGPSYEEQDRATRLFLYRGDMEKEWKAYGPDTERVVASFVNGINAYVEMTEENPDILPEEFKLLGYKPTKWEPEDIVRIRSHGLTRNIKSEVARAITLRQFGEEAESIRQRLEPDWKINIPKGLDLFDIPEDVLDTYNLATKEVYFDKAELTVKSESLNEQIEFESGLGSNNWVIAPEKSKTGRPILANDPHRTLAVPSLRYIAHLSAPGLNVIGGGEPVLPGISIGHNGTAAFGLTIFAIDQEDLYVYETNPENPSQYLYKGQWESMKTISEKIAVKGKHDQLTELQFTRHGPIIYKDEEKNRAFAVRAAWLEPGMAPYLGSLSYMGAENWEDFSKAMNNWGSPSENQVYADTNGNIGWKPGGLTPVRDNWDGLLPVPGDGSYEWDGFLNQENLPFEFNPERGWVASANEMNLPEDYAYEKYKLGFEWSFPFRSQRIAEVLSSKKKVGIDDSLRLQTDYLSIPGRRVTSLVSNLESNDKKLKEALKMLRKWDGNLDVDSSAGALFEVWYQHHLRQAVVGQILSKEAAKKVGSGDPVVLLNLLENPDQRFGNEPKKTRDEILLNSLKDAIKHVEELLGPNMNRWKWGDLHHVYLEHQLSNLVDDKLRKKLNVGPVPRGGSGDTVGAATYNTTNFRQTSGATYRMVLDVGNWDNSIAVNSPGQSGDPRSEHYADLFNKWANDEAIPLLYSRKKIEGATKERIILLPGK